MPNSVTSFQLMSLMTWFSFNIARFCPESAWMVLSLLAGLRVRVSVCLCDCVCLCVSHWLSTGGVRLALHPAYSYSYSYVVAAWQCSSVPWCGAVGPNAIKTDERSTFLLMSSSFSSRSVPLPPRLTAPMLCLCVARIANLRRT